MIRIETDGMCAGCLYADLELDFEEMCNGKKIWSVRCLHQDACEHMETVTINRINNGKGE